RAVAAEGGRLAFLTPIVPLQANSQYFVFVDGVLDKDGRRFPFSRFAFSTKAVAPSRQTGASNLQASTMQMLPPLQAASGVTALAGQVLRVDGQPLGNVTLTLAGKSARSDATGRFLISSVPVGRNVLQIDGRPAADQGNRFGYYEASVIVDT